MPEPRSGSVARAIDMDPVPFKPTVLFTVQDQTVYMARVSGDAGWYEHAEEQLFLGWRGTTTVRLEGGDEYRLGPGDFLIVPAGVAHESAGDDAYVLHLKGPGGMTTRKHDGDPGDRSIAPRADS